MYEHGRAGYRQRRRTARAHVLGEEEARGGLRELQPLLQERARGGHHRRPRRRLGPRPAEGGGSGASGPVLQLGWLIQKLDRFLDGAGVGRCPSYYCAYGGSRHEAGPRNAAA